MHMILQDGFLDLYPYSRLQGLEKWTLLYLYSNADSVGFTNIKPSIFEIESGIHVSDVEATMQKIQEEAIKVDGGYWFRRMVFEQYGRSDQKLRENTMFTTIIKHLSRRNYPPGFVSMFLAEYPIFKEPYEAFVNHGIEPPFIKKPSTKNKQGPKKRITKNYQPPPPPKQEPETDDSFEY
jgi:hypothetical protein